MKPHPDGSTEMLSEVSDGRPVRRGFRASGSVSPTLASPENTPAAVPSTKPVRLHAVRVERDGSRFDLLPVRLVVPATVSDDPLAASASSRDSEVRRTIAQSPRQKGSAMAAGLGGFNQTGLQGREESPGRDLRAHRLRGASPRRVEWAYESVTGEHCEGVIREAPGVMADLPPGRAALIESLLEANDHGRSANLRAIEFDRGRAPRHDRTPTKKIFVDVRSLREQSETGNAA